MYTSDELNEFPKQFERIFAALENDILIDIIDRIQKNDEITRTADWQMYRLIQLGETMETIQKRIQEALKLSNGEVEHLYGDLLGNGYARDESLYKAVGQSFIPYEENEQLQQLIGAVKKQTTNEFTNLTRTMGFAVKNPAGKTEYKTLHGYLQKVLDEAAMHTINGSYDYNSIVKKVVNDMTNSGIRSIDYESGVSNRIDVAARRAVITGLNQVTAKISEDNMEKLDTEYVEVSWHGTARPTHQVWQGRVFYWDKSNPNAESTVDGVLYKSFIKETGYGTVEGLCGANCRHTFYSFIPGVSVRNYTDEELNKLNEEENSRKEYNGKEYTKYEATQYQRKLERIMRKQRQDIKLLKESGLTDDDDEVIFARSRYRKTSAKYKDFCEKMGLREERERVYLDGLKDIGKGKYAKREKFSKNTSEEQNYKPIEIDKQDSLQDDRGKIDITARKITSSGNNIYVSDDVKLKPKAFHNIDMGISGAIEKLEIADADNLPQIIIISDREMQTGALASYNPVKNIMYVSETIGDTKKLLELQKDTACPKNVLSTYVHEYIHWRDAESYRAGHGVITDNNEYLAWIRRKSKKQIDNLIRKGYNVSEVSKYANSQLKKDKYDEAYTEYRVKKLLGE